MVPWEWGFQGCPPASCTHLLQSPLSPSVTDLLTACSQLHLVPHIPEINPAFQIYPNSKSWPLTGALLSGRDSEGREMFPKEPGMGKLLSCVSQAPAGPGQEGVNCVPEAAIIPSSLHPLRQPQSSDLLQYGAEGEVCVFGGCFGVRIFLSLCPSLRSAAAGLSLLCQLCLPPLLGADGWAQRESQGPDPAFWSSDTRSLTRVWDAACSRGWFADEPAQELDGGHGSSFILLGVHQKPIQMSLCSALQRKHP